MSTTGKRKANNENDPPLSWVQCDPNQPKKARRKAITLTPALREENSRAWAVAQEMRAAEVEKEKERMEMAQKEGEQQKLVQTWAGVREKGASAGTPKTELATDLATGYNMFSFLESTFQTTDQQLGSQLTKMVNRHAPQLLTMVRERDQSTGSLEWIKTTHGLILAEEMDAITGYLRPAQKSDVSTVLKEFSLDKLLRISEDVAPHIHELVLKLLGHNEGQATRKHKDVVCYFILSQPILQF
jgi:hypothetical protein